MALKATIYKVHLNIADMDRNYYSDHNLTIARHPSETENRLMVRVLAYANFASENLEFTKGLSVDDEADIWEKDLTGHITHWVELGLPDEDRIRKASNRSDQITVVAYGERSAAVWWDKHKNRLQRFANLRVFFVPDEQVAAITENIERTMELQVSIQENEMWVAINGESIAVTFQLWK